jgi:hypothetical protein
MFNIKKIDLAMGEFIFDNTVISFLSTYFSIWFFIEKFSFSLASLYKIHFNGVIKLKKADKYIKNINILI